MFVANDDLRGRIRTIPDLQKPRIGFHNIVAVLLFWAGVTAITIGAGAVAAAAPLRHGVQAIVIGSVASIGIFVLTLLFARHLRTGATEFGIVPDRASLARFMSGLFFGILLALLYVGILTLLGPTGWVRNPEVPFTAGMAMFVAALALASAEELAFRGFPLRYLARTGGYWLAQAVVAVAFIIYHILIGWPLLPAIVGTGTGALLFGISALASRGLALPIGIHAAWNFGSWTVGGTDSAGFWSAAGNVGLEGLVAYLVAGWIGIAFLWVWHRRNLHLNMIGGGNRAAAE